MTTLLFLCILIPVLLFGYFSIRRVEAKLQDNMIRRMAFRTREVAMAIHSGLGFMEEQAKILTVLIERDRGSLSWLENTRLILGTTLVRDGCRTERLYGNACALPPMDRASLDHLAAGKGVLYIERAPDGTHRAFIAQPIPGKDPAREMLSFEIRLGYLWELVQDAVPPASEVTILSPAGDIFFRTGDPPLGLIDRVLRERDSEHVSHFEWNGGKDPLLAFHAMVFLKPSLHSERWTVVATRLRSEAFASADQFVRILFLTIAAILLLAGLFALVLVRRNLAPLAMLEAGTRRISGGDFESRIEIRTGDEFEDLARSFNTMADHLGREFRTQAELGRVIQYILGETDEGRIVRTLLDNLDALVPCDCAGLALIEGDGNDLSAVTCTRSGADGNPSGTDTILMSLSPGEAERLKSSETSLVARPGGEFEGFLSLWPGARPALFLLSPLYIHGELMGVLLLGCAETRVPSHEDLVRLRQVADQTAVALSRARLVEELNENDLGTLQALSRAVDTNSPWTAGHSQRVTSLAMEIGRELGLPQKEIDLLQRGGLLHDLGKLGIPPSILDKPGSLTEEEFALIRMHPSSGEKILRPIPALQKVIPIVAQHHERFDGSGYPLGVAGGAISLHARIVAVADVVDALFSDRPYRGGWKQEKVLAYMIGKSGTMFDPDVVDAFLRIAGRNAGTVPVRRGAAFSAYSEPLRCD